MKINSTSRKAFYKMCHTCFRFVLIYNNDSAPCPICGTKAGEGLEIMSLQEGRQYKKRFEDKHREWLLDKMVDCIESFPQEKMREFVSKLGKTVGYEKFVMLLRELSQ